MCPDLFTFTTDSRAIAVVIQLDNSHQNFAAFFSLMERDRIYIHTDYGLPERNSPSLHGQKFNPKFLDTAKAGGENDNLFRIYKVINYID